MSAQTLTSFNECIISTNDFKKTNKAKLFPKINKSEIKSHGKYPVISQSFTEILGYTDNKSLLYSGILPIIVFGDHNKTVKFLETPFAIFGSGVRVIIPNQSVVLPKYLYYLISALKFPNLGYSRYYSYLQEQSFNIPCLEVQSEIVKQADSDFAVIKRKEAQNNLAFERALRKKAKIAAEKSKNLSNFLS